MTDAPGLDEVGWNRLWPSAAGLERLAQQFSVLGLSNAGRTALLRLNAHAGLRRHQALSSEAVLTDKPAPEVYLTTRIRVARMPLPGRRGAVPLCRMMAGHGITPMSKEVPAACGT